MKCPDCGDEPPSGARYCPACGTALPGQEEAACTRCGAPTLAAARFCWACGAARSSDRSNSTLSLFAPADSSPASVDRSLGRFLPAQYLERLRASRGVLSGERRVVTILFADVKGSTAIADRMDPEEVLEIMNGAFRVLIEPVTRHEGTIARLMGDAVLAFFGAPVAHEDDPDRAARAAIEIVSGARRYAEQLERGRGITGFDVRVGMNTGLVVLAEVGDGDRVEYTAMGDAVNLASRMESAAEPGTILMTEATRKLLGTRFVTASVGALAIRGKAEPVQVHRLLAANVDDHPQGRVEGVRLVGRSSEIARLRQIVEHLRRGKGALVAISGEAGMGKTRIVNEVRRTWDRSWHWAEVRKADSQRKSGDDAARAILLGLMRYQEQDQGRAPSLVLREQLHGLDADATPHLLPYLSMVLGCADQGVVERLRHLEPEVLRARIAGAARQYLRLLASTGPTAIVWDDFHEVDIPSQTLLEFLLPVVREAPVVFLLVYRDAEGGKNRFLERIRGEYKTQVRHLHLGPLSREGSVQMLAALLGGKRIPQELRREILGKTQGNALYLQEVARQLLDDLAQRPGMSAKSVLESQGLRIPETLRGIVMSRFDALAEPEREALQGASVLAGPFDVALLSGLLGGFRPQQAVVASLEELTRLGFLVSEHVSGLSPSYDFSHELTRQLVAENLLHAQRRVLHRRAAETMEELFAGNLDEHAQTLAWHHELAGNPRRAVEWLFKAIDRAGSLAAAQFVVELCTRALALAREDVIGLEQQGELHERLADALAMVARYGDALDEYERARRADAPILARAVLERKRAAVLEKIGRYDEAMAGFEQALDLLKSAMDLPEAARVFLGLARVYCRRGECSTGIDMSLIALELTEQEADDWGIALACNTLGVIRTVSGEHDSALEALRRAESILQAKKERYDLSATLTNLGWVYHKMGRSEEAAEHLRRSIQLCEATGNRHGLATASDLLSQVLMQRGQRREADRYLRKAVKIFASGGDQAMIPELWGQMGAW